MRLWNVEYLQLGRAMFKIRFKVRETYEKLSTHLRKTNSDEHLKSGDFKSITLRLEKLKLELQDFSSHQLTIKIKSKYLRLKSTKFELKIIIIKHVFRLKLNEFYLTHLLDVLTQILLDAFTLGKTRLMINFIENEFARTYFHTGTDENCISRFESGTTSHLNTSKMRFLNKYQQQ